MDSRPGVPDEDHDRASPREKRRRRLLAELEELRRQGIFTEVQFEDERRRVERDAEAADLPPRGPLDE